MEEATEERRENISSSHSATDYEPGGYPTERHKSIMTLRGLRALFPQHAQYQELGREEGVKYRRGRHWTTSLVLHGMIFIAYAATLSALVFRNQIPGYDCQKEVLFTPARKKIRFEPHLFTDLPNKYRGNPRQEVDDAWFELLKHAYFRISKEEVLKLGRDPDKVVAISDDKGGYVAEFEVTHLLHCINLIRMSYTLDYYPYWVDRLSADPGSDLLLPRHIDHCLNEMRQAFMCNADLTVLTSKWVNPNTGEDDGTPWLDWDAEHECMNWQDVVDFQLSRADFDINDGVLVHPGTGVPFGWDGDPGATEATNYNRSDTSMKLRF